MPDDFRSEMAALLETGGRATLKSWETLLKHGGKKKFRFDCDHCKQRNTREIEILNVEEQRRVLDFLASNVLAKPKDDPGAASSLYVRKLEELTDDELLRLLDEPD